MIITVSIVYGVRRFIPVTHMYALDATIKINEASYFIRYDTVSFLGIILR